MDGIYDDDLESRAAICFENASACPQRLSECFHKLDSKCPGEVLSSRYDNASASWVVFCAILMFFMKAGFLFLEEAFSKNDVKLRRRVVLAKYVDIFAGTFGFWLFGYAISGNTDALVLGEEQDYIFWFFRFTFASNTATILGGTLVGQQKREIMIDGKKKEVEEDVHLRTIAIFVYSFIMTSFIHPGLARFFWSSSSSNVVTFSPYARCNGTYMSTRDHEFTFRDSELKDFIYIDFAGSGLVHLCGGIGGLVLAVFHKLETGITDKIYQHKKNIPCNLCGWLDRKHVAGEDTEMPGGEEEDKKKEVEKSANVVERFIEWMYPSDGGEANLEYAALGIIILWTTWFAFNAGSIESISGKAVHAAVGRIALVMCLACASAGTVQVIVCALVQIYKCDDHFNINEIANVVLGALVAVTGCNPFIDPRYAILIGVLTVVVYHLGCMFEYAIGVYDGARVFPVHGACGLWGVLCVGIFSRGCLIEEVYDDLCFCVSSELPAAVNDRGLLFAYQLAGGLIILVWSLILCTFIFGVMWFIPVKAVVACLPGVWCFKKKFRLMYEGNLLFTHFNEVPSKMEKANEEENNISADNPIPLNPVGNHGIN